MINLHKKYEVSMFINYKNMKGDEKCKNCGSFGSYGTLGTSPFEREHTTSYSTLIETTRLSCTVFELTTSYLSKVTYFDLSHMH